MENLDECIMGLATQQLRIRRSYQVMSPDLCFADGILYLSLMGSRNKFCDITLRILYRTHETDRADWMLSRILGYVLELLLQQRPEQDMIWWWLQACQSYLPFRIYSTIRLMLCLTMVYALCIRKLIGINACQCTIPFVSYTISLGSYHTPYQTVLNMLRPSCSRSWLSATDIVDS